MSRTKKRRSGIQIMGQLIGLVKSMLHIMLAAILLGNVGYLCAIFLTITASKAVMKVAGGGALSGRLFFRADSACSDAGAFSIMRSSTAIILLRFKLLVSDPPQSFLRP